MLVPDKYDARAIDAYLAETKSGKPHVVVDLEVAAGNFMGERITAYLFLTDKAAERSIESLRHLGWRGTNIHDLVGVTDNMVQIVVEREVYDGRERAKVRWINRIGAPSMPALPESKAASINAALQSRIAAVDAKLAKKKTEDLPF